MRRTSICRASPKYIVALAAAAVLAGSGCASSTDSASSSDSGSSGTVATTTDAGSGGSSPTTTDSRNPCDSSSSAYDASQCGNSSSNGAGQSSKASGNSTSFCSTHSCIDNFDNGTGYVVQCNDGMWSHSGGRPGACSHHSGESSTTAQDQTAQTTTTPTELPGTVTGADSTGHNVGIGCSDNPQDPLPGCNDGNGRGPADNLSYGSVTGTDSSGYKTGVGCSDDPDGSLPKCENG